MSSIPSHSVTIQDSQAQRIKVLEAENRQLRSQIAWDDKLFANPRLSLSHKAVLRSCVHEISKSGVRDRGELTKIFIPAIAQKIGLSAKTTGKSITYLADAGAIIRETETQTDEAGQRITRVFIGLTDQVKHPEQITPPIPRNHGGKRERCPSCGSEQLLEEKRIICTDCGEIISTTQRFVNPCDPTGRQDESRNTREEKTTIGSPKAACSDSPKTSIPMDNTSPLLQPKEPEDNLTVGEMEKPATPREPHDPEIEVSNTLFAIAGDSSEHIVMSRGGKKYVTVHRPITPDDISAHLKGKKTLGATLARRDGTTRALCFDADNTSTWQRLHEASALLIAQGFKPILEPSPAGRGGHLWLIFNDLVNARQAYARVYDIAPMLKEIKEYWPRPGNQKVRLPKGKYVTSTFSAWCYLYDAAGTEISNLTLHQTPAGLILQVPVPDAQTQRPLNRDRSPVTKPEQVGQAGIDEYHKQKYPQNSFWFAWTPAQLASWYNERYPITDLLPPERNGNGLAAWRGERTASVAYTKDGTGWVDFGAAAGRHDGKRDGGDSLELTTRIEQLPKSAVMREAASLLLSEARATLESAAASGNPLPSWLVPFMTPAGWIHYRQCLKEAENPMPDGRQDRGVAGFISVQEEPLCPPPPRPCICCNVHAWVWVGDRYMCSHPDHPQEA